jgi:hypothetical protein
MHEESIVAAVVRIVLFVVLVGLFSNMFFFFLNALYSLPTLLLSSHVCNIFIL